MLSITSATSVAATFIAFAAQAVKAQDTSDFSKCFCYNSQTNNFCNGNKWYNADACTDYINNNYSWTIVMVALALLMLTLPCFFVCARYCCRCCGGRYASHGCCCSDEASREFFPGYKNSSIIATRVAFIIAVALAITASAITMHHNTGLHDNVNNVITTVRTSANNLKSYSDAAPAFNQYLSTQPQYISATPVPTISKDGVDEFSRGLNTAHDVENNHWYGRHHLSQSVSAWTLVVPAIALLPMACSWKSSMNFFFIFHIIVAVIVLIAATPSAAASEFISEACHHYSTTSNFVGSGLQYVLGIPNGASLSQSVSNAQYSITTAFAAQTTQGTAGSGLGSSGSGTVTSSAPTFCSDFISVCASIGGCVSSPCGYATAAPHGCNGQAPTYFQVGPGYRASMMQAVTQTCSSGSTNIAAMSTSNAKANQLYQFALGTSAIGDLMAWDGYMWPITVDSLFAVCDAVKPKASSVAVGLFMQFVISLVMLVVLFLGIKRFTHLNTYNTANDYTVVPQGAHVTAIIVVGEPQRPDYLLNAMPTTPTADYGSAVAKELPDSI